MCTRHADALDHVVLKDIIFEVAAFASLRPRVRSASWFSGAAFAAAFVFVAGLPLSIIQLSVLRSFVRGEIPG